MGDRLIFFLLGLTRRERILLAALALVAFPVAVWVGVLHPLIERRDAARTELADALVLRQWVLDGAETAARLRQAGQGADTRPIGIAGLENTLIAAGLREHVTDLARRGGDVIELRFEDVPFAALGQWLGDVSLGWGYDISLFRVERGTAPGVVEASFNLVPRG